MDGLTKFCKNFVKEDGFILVDANKKEYIIGKPIKNPAIKLKLLDKSLHYKLLILPDLYFGEAYTNGDLIVENGTLSDFLNLALMNFGRGELNFFSYLLNITIRIFFLPSPSIFAHILYCSLWSPI